MKTVEELFSFKTSQSEMRSFFKNITDTYNKENGYSSIPKMYSPYLNMLRSYCKYDHRGQYRDDEIRTWFVGRREGNNCIMFFDVNGNRESLGVTNTIKQWQKEKWNFWDYERDTVLSVLRNIANVAVTKFKRNIVLPVKDEIDGKMLYDIKNIHIDHFDNDFAQVAFDWLLLNKKRLEKYYKRGVDIVDLMYEQIDDKKQYFKSRETSLDFYNYHNAHTHLRVTSKENNLKKQKISPEWEYLKTNGKYKMEYDKQKEFNK